MKIAQKQLYLTPVPSYNEFIKCLTLECLILSILDGRYGQLIQSIQKFEKHSEIDIFQKISIALLDTVEATRLEGQISVFVKKANYEQYIALNQLFQRKSLDDRLNVSLRPNRIAQSISTIVFLSNRILSCVVEIKFQKVIVGQSKAKKQRVICINIINVVNFTVFPKSS